MNENLNLVEILKDCPEGTKLYSTVHGEVIFINIDNKRSYPIIVMLSDTTEENFTSEGKLVTDYDGECTLFPSKSQRDWSKFKVKKPKFDPKTLQPFDKVLVRDLDTSLNWYCVLFFHYENEDKYPCICAGVAFNACIPYNDDTKHLVGTTKEAPEFYRYWED